MSDTATAVPASDATVLALIDTLVETYELGILGQTVFTADAVVRTGCRIGPLARLASDFDEATILAQGTQLLVAITVRGRRLELVGEWSE